MKRIIKKVSDLTPNDFLENPIWGWYENIEDESLVTPVEEHYLLSADNEEFDTLFIFSELELSDKTSLQGEIALRLDSKEIYMLSFFRDNKIFTVSLHPKLIKKLDTLKEVSRWLQKPIGKIFPIKYQTLYSFNDGSKIIGVINLPEGCLH